MEHISFFYKKSVIHIDLPWIKSALASRTKMVPLFLGWVHGWKCLRCWEWDGTCRFSSVTQRMCHSHSWFLTEGHKANQIKLRIQYCESEMRINLCVSADSDCASSHILMPLWVRSNPSSGAALEEASWATFSVENLSLLCTCANTACTWLSLCR